jgi:hypothetical protein
MDAFERFCSSLTSGNYTGRFGEIIQALRLPKQLPALMIAYATVAGRCLKKHFARI